MRVEVAIRGTLVTSGRWVKGVTSVMVLGKIVITKFHGYKLGWFLFIRGPFHLYSYLGLGQFLEFTFWVLVIESSQSSPPHNYIVL